jgi:hypothetical protein
VGAAQPLTLAADSPAAFEGSGLRTGVKVTPSTENPLGAMLSSSEALYLQRVIAMCATAAFAVLSVVYWLCGDSCRSSFRSLDYLFDLDHYVPDGESAVKRPQAIGGVFTVIAVFCMLTMSALASVEYFFEPVYTKGVSPDAPPFRPAGLYNISVRLLGAAASCPSPPTITAPEPFDVVGASTTGFRALASTCEMHWACANCVFATSSFSVSFAVVEADSFAAGIEYTIQFPGFSFNSSSSSASSPSSTANDNVPPPFKLTSALFPLHPLKSVFRGSNASVVSISLVPVVFRSTAVGSFADLVSALPGSAVNESTYTREGNGVSVSFHIALAPYIFDVQETPRFPLQLLAQIASLVGTILVACKVVMNAVESCARDKPWLWRPKVGRCCCCQCRCCERNRAPAYVELADADGIN